MVRIAIVEDEQEQADRLQSHIRRYGEEHQIGTQVTVCSNVITFLEQYKAEFDIVFMVMSASFLTNDAVISTPFRVTVSAAQNRAG